MTDLFSINESQNKFITLWNTFEPFAHHRPNTKLYARTEDYVHRILEGTFDKPLDKKWMHINHIKNYFKEPMTPATLINALFTYEKQFQPEYYPENKSKLTRSFGDFLYNPVTKTSQLLYVLSGNVRKIDAVEPETYRAYLPEYLAHYVDSIIRQKAPKLSSKKRQRAYIQTRETVQAHADMVKKLKPYLQKNIAFMSYIANTKQFFASWYNYLNNQPELYDYLFAPKGFTWQNFLSKLERDHALSLSTDIQDLPNVQHVEKDFETIVRDDEDILKVYAQNGLP